MKRILIYDATLRDGTQGEHISFSVKDKIDIVKQLDEFGMDYIEGGWPGSNPKDIEFFEKMKKIKLKRAKLAAFGSTCRSTNKPENDPNIKALIAAGTQVITIFGKSSLLHVKDILKITPSANLQLIEDSIKYLKLSNKEVIYDAEHFFDGFKDNPEYALKSLELVCKAKADTIVLCDTNGGTLSNELKEIIKEVKKKISIPLGIHAHNDSDLAVANSLLAAELGCVQIQGTINGYGERCGNANLCSIIPNLILKLNFKYLEERIKLNKLTQISQFIDEMANLIPRLNQPYVGISAFAHKGGVHVDAIRKNSRSYEHIEPKEVGNIRRVLISELSGKSSILYKAQMYGIGLTKDAPEADKLLNEIKRLEHQGYEFESAEASFKLLMKKILGKHKKFFHVEGFRVIVEKRKNQAKLISEATVKIKVDDISQYTVAEGNGPVNALDNALRKALEKFYPNVKTLKLIDYKVRILDSKEGTKAVTRVLIESTDHKESWRTIGVSENIIEASWQALLDSIEYKLLKDEREKNL